MQALLDLKAHFDKMSGENWKFWRKIDIYPKNGEIQNFAQNPISAEKTRNSGEKCKKFGKEMLKFKIFLNNPNVWSIWKFWRENAKFDKQHLRICWIKYFA